MSALTLIHRIPIRALSAFALAAIVWAGPVTIAAQPATSGRGAPAVVVDGVPDDLQLREGAAGARTAVWTWGSLVVDADGPTVLRDGERLIVDGPLDLTTVGEGGDDGPYLFTAPGLTLHLDSSTSVRFDDGVLRVTAPDAGIDPRAGIIMFLGILVLTAAMMRHTRRSLASR